jgi:hypothetical protein
VDPNIKEEYIHYNDDNDNLSPDEQEMRRKQWSSNQMKFPNQPTAAWQIPVDTLLGLCWVAY